MSGMGRSLGIVSALSTSFQFVTYTTYIQSVALVHKVAAMTGLIQCTLTADQANQNIVTGKSKAP